MPTKFNFIKKHCKICGKELQLNNTRDIKRKAFCSNECKGIDLHNRCPNPNPTGGPVEYLKLGRTPENRIRAAKTHSGSGHWGWITDRSKLKKKRGNASDRNTYETSNHRKGIFNREDYTCRDCGIRGGTLNAHHIFSYAKFPDYRYEIWNGVTLCEKCHKERHYAT